MLSRGSVEHRTPHADGAPLHFTGLLPVRVNKQGNVIGSVRIYIYMCTKKIVIERTRNLIYLKVVATDFFPEIISPSTGENSGDSV